MQLPQKSLLLFTLIICLILVFATGCPTNQKPDDAQPDQDQQEPAPDNQQADLDFNITALVGQWVNSNHSNVVLSPAGRDNCIACHDGGAYANKQTMLEELEREFPVAQDCRACHTGQGIELQQSGTVNIASQDDVQGGLGALCMSCHNERKTPDPEQRPAPHGSSQAGVFTGTGGAQIEGFDFGSHPHTGIENTCVACHMPETEEGFSSHTFRIESTAVCSQCHGDINDVNLQAKEDYDGNGNNQGFQDEVEGLLSLLEQAISEATNGASVGSSSGSVVFLNDAEEEVEVTDEAIYNAGFNYLLISNDGSLGVHNPTYVVQLLQQSYKAITGEDVPNATIR